MSLSVIRVRDQAALQALEPAWASLWARSDVATPFQHPAWTLSWWTAFHPGSLETIAVWDGGALIGLAPLYRETTSDGSRLLPLGIGISDYLDALVDPRSSEAVGHAIAEALAGETIHWEDCLPQGAALALPCPPGSSDTTFDHQACPILDLRHGGPSLSSVLPRSKLKGLRLARNRASRRGGRIEMATAERATDIFDHLVRLHGARWDTRGEAGVLADPAVRHFHSIAVPRLFEAGLLRLSAMWIDEIVAGVFYSLASPGHAYGYLSGFDPAFGFESPGVILIAHAIEQAQAEDAETFHFLRGQESYKYEWGVVDRWTRKRIIEPLP